MQANTLRRSMARANASLAVQIAESAKMALLTATTVKLLMISSVIKSVDAQTDSRTKVGNVVNQLLPVKKVSIMTVIDALIASGTVLTVLVNSNAMRAMRALN